MRHAMAKCTNRSSGRASTPIEYRRPRRAIAGWPFPRTDAIYCSRIWRSRVSRKWKMVHVSARHRSYARKDACTHRARVRPGDRLNVESCILQQIVEHAPGESPVQTAALQVKSDLLLAGPVDRIVRMRHANPSAEFTRPSNRHRSSNWIP